MASSGLSTQYAELSQWLLSDKPGMDDFNQDNQKTDRKLYELSQKLEALEQKLAQKADKGEERTLKRHTLQGADTSIFSEGTGFYEKDEKGYVFVRIGATASKGGAGVLGVLPEGYRPYVSARTGCGFRSSVSGIEVGSVHVRTDGVIVCDYQAPRKEPRATGVLNMIGAVICFPTRFSN